MTFEFKLPDIGEGVVEGELVKWLVDEGQAVEEDTELFEVLTDKVSAVIPSPVKGTVDKRFYAEGDIVPVGAVVLSIREGAATTPQATAAGDGGEGDASARDQPPTSAAQTAPAAAKATAAAASHGQATSGAQVRATPATRKLARTLQVDITQVPASGDSGRVTRADVEAWAARAARGQATDDSLPAPPVAPRPAPKPVGVNPADRTVRIIGLRRRISEAMRHSKDAAAHFTFVEEVDFTEIVGMQQALGQHGLRVTFLPFVMKAVAAVLGRPAFHNLNAHVDHDKGELYVKADIHLGIATATEAGLIVPVVPHVAHKSLRALAAELSETSEATRAGQIEVGRLSGSTFTITSLGKLGGMFATPIINQPEVAILGLHRVEKRPVVIDGQIAVRDRMYMSCSFDHRIIDGHIGAAFVIAIKELLETPALLLAELS